MAAFERIDSASETAEAGRFLNSAVPTEFEQLVAYRDGSGWSEEAAKRLRKIMRLWGIWRTISRLVVACAVRLKLL